MKHKSEVPHLFSHFKAQVENLLSTTIKILRTDGGTEYLPITKQFPHIIHQTSCPYTPQQNGLAERKHRHIIELALAIMSQASLPSLYWDEICSSVVYLINRLPSPSNSNKIPYTDLLHKPPDYSFLRVLGCICFPYTRPYNSNKLENRALPCLFLGYATTQKGYRCLHLPTNRLYISRHVRFDESCFPFKKSPPADTSFDSADNPYSTAPHPYSFISAAPTPFIPTTNHGPALPHGPINFPHAATSFHQPNSPNLYTSPTSINHGPTSTQAQLLQTSSPPISPQPTAAINSTSEADPLNSSTNQGRPFPSLPDHTTAPLFAHRSVMVQSFSTTG